MGPVRFALGTDQRTSNSCATSLTVDVLTPAAGESVTEGTILEWRVKVGDPIKPEYFDGLLAAALVSEAIDAYNDGRYAEALDLYSTARKTPAGDQLRVYNGIYLSQVKLGHPEQAAEAFSDLVQYGLHKKQLAVKFLFQPGSVRFVSDAKLSGNYGMWVHQIAAQAAANRICLQIVGHTSPSGPAALNDSLSLLRAEYIQTRLEGEHGIA